MHAIDDALRKPVSCCSAARCLQTLSTDGAHLAVRSALIQQKAMQSCLHWIHFHLSVTQLSDAQLQHHQAAQCWQIDLE